MPTTSNAAKLNALLPSYWDAFMNDDGAIQVAICDEVTFEIIDNKLVYPKTLDQIREEFGNIHGCDDLLIFEINYRKVETIIEVFLQLAPDHNAPSDDVSKFGGHFGGEIPMDIFDINLNK